MNLHAGRGTRRPNLHDAGSASLWAVAFAMVFWAVTAVVVECGVAIAARHQAATAADLAALAGAAVAARPDSNGGGSTIGNATSASSDSTGSNSVASNAGPARSPCTSAASVAEANGAHLVACTVEGETVTVVAAIPLRGLAQLIEWRSGKATASARAGPG